LNCTAQLAGNMAFQRGTPPSSFSRILLSWHKKRNSRKMPWKGEKDPYKIWLSEVILQQTRVEQGIKYYESFTKTFPTITRLASAEEGKVYKLWEGLGYYSRCKNLIATAKSIAVDYGGRFPDNYKEILNLKGVGPYTAAAIASFAFNLPYAVVDGNVYRILARRFGINKPIDLPAGKKYFDELANELMDKRTPAIYNQAIMDFGATVCKPVPNCGRCPFRNRCKARLHDEIEELPVRTKKQIVTKRWFYFLIPEFEKKLGINQRIEKDIWHNLYQFPVVETKKELDRAGIIREAEKKLQLRKKEYSIEIISPVYQQKLSHQHIAGKFIKIKLKKKPNANDDFIWATRAGMRKYAFPKFINQYLIQEGIV
jgi:A/G-specific adenine glycosylase